MARRARGQVIAPKGKQRSWALRFPAYGERQFLTLGRPEEGWDRERAEAELRHILADVERGIWKPYRAPAFEAPPDEPTFHEFASEWFHEHEHEWADRTQVDYRWRLSHYLLPFFKDHRLSAISIAEVDRYKAERLKEGKLSPSSINKTIVLLSSILEVAEERELITRNTARGKRRRVKARQPRRPYMDTASQIEALLNAACELDAESQDHPQLEKRIVPRKAILATLVLSGVRIGELCALRWRDVDLATGRLRVGDAKTDAGRRDVRLLAALRDELATHKAGTADPSPAAFVFATAKGGRPSESNIRNRIIAKAVERANENLAKVDELPLPDGLTPHAMRRTFASVLYALGESPAEVMAQLGHTHPGLALRIYAQTMRHDGDERNRLTGLVEGESQAERGRIDGLGTEERETDEARNDEIPHEKRDPERAADGIRTHDLLHGKHDGDSPS